MTDWERITSQFEARSTCHHKQRPKVHCEPGCVWIECERGDECKCRLHQDSGEPLTPLMVEWARKFVA